MVDSSALGHLSDFVFTNVYAGTFFGLPRPEFIPLSNTQSVATAVPFHADTITYWHMDDNHVYQQLTHAEAFVESLWLNANFGTGIVGHDQGPLLKAAGLAPPLITAQEVHDVLARPALQAVLASVHLTEAMVWAYAGAVAPDTVQLVGVPPA